MGASFYWGTDSELRTAAPWFAAKLAESPEVYGVSRERADAYVLLVEEWVAAYQAAHSPSTKTVPTTLAKNEVRARLRKETAGLFKTITGTPGLSDAQLMHLGVNVRSTSRTAGPPGTPTAFRCELSGIGQLMLKWKCSNPTPGTVYEIHRALDNGPSTYLATVGKKSYIDSTVPKGTSRVSYRVRGTRPTATGLWAQFSVTFGVDEAIARAMLRSAA